MKNLMNTFSSGRNTASARILQRAVVLVALVAFAIPAMAQNNYVVTSHFDASGGETVKPVNWKFEANRYGQLKIKLHGDWKIMWLNNPSQHFKVVVNGKNVYEHDLVGDAEVSYVLSAEEYGKPINVDVTMRTASMADRASGDVTITCYEGQVGKFYIENITYDFAHKVELDREVIRGESADYDNRKDRSDFQEFTLGYETTETMQWEKSFSSTTSVEFSAGYSPPSTGGPQWMLKLAQQISTGWKEGRTQSETVKSSLTSKVEIPAHTRTEVYILKYKEWVKVPYTMTGYYMRAGGVKEAASITDTSTFSNFSKIEIVSQDVDSNAEPVVLKSVDIKN